jgi:hypothetical protein
MMLEELQRRNYSDHTIRHHLRSVTEFAEHFGKPPDKLGLDELRSYQVYLLKRGQFRLRTVVDRVVGYQPSAPALDAMSWKRCAELL